MLRIRKFGVTNDLRTAFIVVGLGFFAASTAAETQPADLADGWRLLRAANPRGGPDSVSMSHTADISRSDLDLAGLMLRCGEKGIEVAFVVVTPFSPHAHPDITIEAGGKAWRFAARVISPGAQLLLPAEAASLVTGPWTVAHELTVNVKSEEQSFHGVVPIDGIGKAVAELAAKCPSS